MSYGLPIRSAKITLYVTTNPSGIPTELVGKPVPGEPVDLTDEQIDAVIDLPFVSAVEYRDWHEDGGIVSAWCIEMDFDDLHKLAQDLGCYVTLIRQRLEFPGGIPAGDPPRAY